MRVKSFHWILILIGLLSLVWLSGLYLDHQAEHDIQNDYTHDSQGIIKGLEPVQIIHHNQQALIFLHGFLSSPAMFSELIADIEPKIKHDIFVPLLPFHGRNLVSAAQFNNQQILGFIEQYIQQIAKQYNSVTIIGMSYGGSILAKLAYEDKLPANVHLIFYAPAFFLKDNTLINRIESRLYYTWRKYCNYAALGCHYPEYASGDSAAKTKIQQEKSLRYIVLPALLQLFQFDLENRHILQNLKKPYALITAVDDNRVSYAEQKKACAMSKQCHFYSFPSGKHIIHWGHEKQRFETLLMSLFNS